MWTLLVSNDPTENRFISQSETDMILRERREFRMNSSLLPPMHKILKIPTVWIVAISDFGANIAFYFVITEGPTFISKVLGKKDITTVSKVVYEYLYRIFF